MPSIVTPVLTSILADNTFNEIQSGSSTYYFSLGRTNEWPNELEVLKPAESASYEREARNNSLLYKRVKPSDSSIICNRHEWKAADIFDEYDDSYGTEIIGLDIIDGGVGYQPNDNLMIGVFGNGSGASFKLIVNDGQIVGYEKLSGGVGYTTAFLDIPEPDIPVEGARAANIEPVLSIPKSGAINLESSKFYCVVDSRNVYKCLNNNGGAPSLEKPTGTDTFPKEYPDGYVWKFMYSIPNSVRQKYMTIEFMPVTTAISSQYYNNGKIVSTNKINSGSGYIYANVEVSGDGYLESNPRLVNSINIPVNGGGEDYEVGDEVFLSTPKTDTPFEWDVSEEYSKGVFLKAGNFVYLTKNSGISGSTPPQFTEGVNVDGSLILEFVGEVARGYVSNVDGSGAITSIDLYSKLWRLFVSDPGSGYVNAPPVTLINNSPFESAVCTVTIQGGRVSNASVLSEGIDYKNPPQIVVGLPFSPSTEYSFGDQIVNESGGLYLVTSVGGVSGAVEPTHLVGTASNGTLELERIGNAAIITAVMRSGYGYEETPNVDRVESDFGIGATLTVITSQSQAILRAVVDSGQITKLEVIDGGVGYTTAVVNIIPSGGVGSGAVFEANLSVGDVNTNQADVELFAVDGEISKVAVVSGGYGYNNNWDDVNKVFLYPTDDVRYENEPKLVINDTGTGAQFRLKVAAGRVVGSEKISGGNNYTFPDIRVEATVGEAAVVRGIVAPSGGHGRNAILELYSNGISFYTSLFEEKIRGLTLVKDYRQVLVYRNLREYDSSDFLNLDSAVSAYTADCTVSPSFNGNDIGNVFINESNGQRFLLNATGDIENGVNRLMFLPLNNGKLLDSQVLISTETAETVTINTVTEPDVNKFSGELVSIDNQEKFKPSIEERITLRSVLSFTKE
jgi:hypothetical protein